MDKFYKYGILFILFGASKNLFTSFVLGGLFIFLMLISNFYKEFTVYKLMSLCFLSVLINEIISLFLPELYFFARPYSLLVFSAVLILPIKNFKESLLFSIEVFLILMSIVFLRGILRKFNVFFEYNLSSIILFFIMALIIEFLKGGHINDNSIKLSRK